MLEEKINTIRDWPTPTDQRQLKSFLGLASYYRRFIKGFSCIWAPLFCLQQKEHAFVWTDECQKAFYTLWQALMESPILVPPDAPLPFILDTDASNIGMGGAIIAGRA